VPQGVGTQPGAAVPQGAGTQPGAAVPQGAGSPWYLTVFNDSPERRTATIALVDVKAPASSGELLSGRAVVWQDGRTTITLEGEDVAVIEMGK